MCPVYGEKLTSVLRIDRLKSLGLGSHPSLEGNQILKVAF